MDQRTEDRRQRTEDRGQKFSRGCAAFLFKKPRSAQRSVLCPLSSVFCLLE